MADLKDIKDGDTATIGTKEYEVDGDTVTMRAVNMVQETNTKADLLARKQQLLNDIAVRQAHIAEIDARLAAFPAEVVEPE